MSTALAKKGNNILDGGNQTRLLWFGQSGDVLLALFYALCVIGAILVIAGSVGRCRI